LGGGVARRNARAPSIYPSGPNAIEAALRAIDGQSRLNDATQHRCFRGPQDPRIDAPLTPH